MDWIEVKGEYTWFEYDLMKAFNKRKKDMDWNNPPETKECTCRYCGEDSDTDFCSSECLKAYKSDN